MSTDPEPSEEEKVKQIEERYRAGDRYIDGSPEHKAALNLPEEYGIKRFTSRQHLFKVLYHLTDPPPKEAKKTIPPPPLPPPPSEPPLSKKIALPVIDAHHHGPDIGGEGGV